MAKRKRVKGKVKSNKKKVRTLSKKRPKKVVKRSKSKKKAKKAGKKVSGKKRLSGKVVGVVTHYFPHVQAAVIKLKGPLALGDKILIHGTTTHFEQNVQSMQIDHVVIQQAKKGDEIGLEVSERVREHDLVLIPS